jgi:ABC-type glycerol-3-phosphate transport system substrate-binding protein
MTTVYGQYDKVLTAIAGGNPPDVVSAVWLNQLMSMAGRGGLTSLTPFAEKDGIDGKAYWPNVWDAWHWNNQLWALAITVNASTFIYRRDTFKEVGLDADNPPKSVADLDAANAKLEKIDSNGAIQLPARFRTLPDGIRQCYGLGAAADRAGGYFRGKFIMREANNLPPCVPLENLHAMYSATRQAGVFPM